MPASSDTPGAWDTDSQAAPAVTSLRRTVSTRLRHLRMNQSPAARLCRHSQETTAARTALAVTHSAIAAQSAAVTWLTLSC